MGWQDDAIVGGGAPWEKDALAAPVATTASGAQQASGVVESFQAGIQGSSAGLVVRGKLPNIELDHEHSKWYERLASGVGGFVGDIPAGAVGLVGGTMAGGAAGTAVPVVGNVAGAVVGGGAGAMALPAAIRESYMQAYTKGEIQNAGEFLDRTGIVLKETGKAAVIGGATMGAGKYAGVGLSAAGVTGARAAVATTAAEAGVATTTAAALEGHLPTLQDFTDNAIFIGGMKGSAAAASKLATIYRKTGKTPVEVMADAAKEPSILDDLKKDLPPASYIETALKTNDGRDFMVRRAGERTNPRFEAVDSEGNLLGHSYDLGGQAGSTDIFVTADGWKGKGVGHALYEASRESAGGELRPSENLSADAMKYWKRRDPVALEKMISDSADATIKSGRKYGHSDEAIIAMEREYANETPLNAEMAAAVEAKLTGKQYKPEWSKPTDPLAEYGPELTSHSGIPQAYREMAARTTAMEAMPTDKLKAVIDKPFADVPDAKLPEGLNTKYLENFDDLAAFDSRITEVFKGEIDAQRGGTQGWAETTAKGEALLREAVGQDAINLMRREAGTADAAHVLHARGMMMFKALADAKEAAAAYDSAPLELKPQLMAKALEEANKAAAFKAYFTGASAEAGRALQFLQYMKDARAQADVMTKMVEAYDGKNPDSLLRALANADSMAEMSKLIENSNKPDFFDKYMDYRRASLMSGYLTIARNTFGGTLMLGKTVLTDAYSAMASKLTPGSDPAHFTQAAARITGYVLATGTMFKEAARTFREADSVKAGLKDVSDSAWEHAVQSSGGAKPMALSADGNLIERAAYYQAKGVFGANTLIDGMMRNFGFYGEMYSRASKQAIEAGLSVGSKQFMDFVQEKVSKPSDKDIAAANKAAAEVVFSGDTGPLLQKVYNTLNEWRGLKVIVPFVGVPGKMFEAGTRMSPFAPLVDSWRKDVAAGGELAQRAHAEAALGRIMWATTANLYKDGNITGYGPPEPDKRAVWLMTHQPYSVKIGENWYNYGQTMQPVGPMLGMVADVMQMADFMTDEEQDRIPKAAFLTFKNAVGNATMLQGAADFFSIFTDEGSLVKFVRNFTTSNLPAAGLMGNIAQGLDPYQREVNSLLDAVKARIPGVRETLNPKRDALGNTVAEPEKLQLGLVPAKSMPVNNDKVATEASRLDIGVGRIPDHIDLPAGKDRRLGKVELTPEEKDRWTKEAGQMANTILQGSISAPDWDELPDQVQRNIMTSAFQRGREYGRKMALSPERLDTEYQRISKGVDKNYSQRK